MRSKLTLMTTAAALVFGLTASAALAEDAPAAKGDAPGATQDITIVKEDTGNAPAAGAEQSTEGQGAANQGSAVPDSATGGTAAQGTPPASDEGGVGAQGGAEDQGATGKSSEDSGAPAAEPPVKEGKLPSPSSAY